jgi:hypothetical protein
MYFDRFDIVSAHYAYYCDYHSGQWSKGYERLCRISEHFNPGPLFKGYDSLSENGQAIYNQLVDRRINSYVYWEVSQT